MRGKPQPVARRRFSAPTGLFRRQFGNVAQARGIERITVRAFHAIP